MSDPRDDLVRCIHCGDCLPACPTFRLTGLETASPRGRVALMRAAAEGRLTWSEVRPALDLCLGCRACEPACPAGVPYGRLLLAARRQAAAHAPRPGLAGLLERAALRHVVPHPRRLRALVRLARLLSRWLPPAEALARRRPPAPAARGASHPPRAATGGPAAVFLGCVQEAAFPETNRATACLVEAAGRAPVPLRGQTCCGALAAHAGDLERARALARKNVAAWLRAGEPEVVTNAGACGALLREYGELLPGEPAAARLGRAVRDLTQVLAGAGLPPRHPLGGVRVTYLDSCHLAHAWGVRREPRALLRALPGAEYVELPGPADCCGAAGAYALFQPRMSRALAERTLDRIRASGARIVATENVGCYLHLRSALRHAAPLPRVEVVPLPDLLAAVHLDPAWGPAPLP